MQTKNKIQPLSHALIQVNHWKEAGKKVVFTNGCFDIIHLGHIDYLEKAKNLGDFLVVGINTDASVKKIKPGRPVIDETSRYRVLAALHFVDLVIPFNDYTPIELIATLLPNILVKGSDYSVQNIVGANEVIAHGGEVKTITLVDGYSTSNIIAKIHTLENL